MLPGTLLPRVITGADRRNQGPLTGSNHSSFNLEIANFFPPAFVFNSYSTLHMDGFLSQLFTWLPPFLVAGSELCHYPPQVCLSITTSKGTLFFLVFYPLSFTSQPSPPFVQSPLLGCALVSRLQCLPITESKAPDRCGHLKKH